VSELSNSHIVDISLSKSHSLAICNKGKVFAWGKVSEGFPMYEDFQSSKEIIKPKGVYRVHVSKDKESSLNVITGPH
jgi:alpha-tubulin suppressor-like RCC1 family protein